MMWPQPLLQSFPPNFFWLLTQPSVICYSPLKTQNISSCFHFCLECFPSTLACLLIASHFFSRSDLSSSTLPRGSLCDALSYPCPTRAVLSYLLVILSIRYSIAVITVKITHLLCGDWYWSLSLEYMLNEEINRVRFSHYFNLNISQFLAHSEKALFLKAWVPQWCQ